MGRVGSGVGRRVGRLDGFRVGRSVGRDVAGRPVGRLVGSGVGRLVGGVGRECVIVIMDSSIVIGRSVGSMGGDVGLRDGASVGRLVGDDDGWFVGGVYDSNPSSHCGRTGFFDGLFVGTLVGWRVGCREGRRVGFLVGRSVGRSEGSFVGLGVGFRVLEEPSVMMVGSNTCETLICSLAMSTASSCCGDAMSESNSCGRCCDDCDDCDDDVSSSPALSGTSSGRSVVGPAPLEGGRAMFLNDSVGGGEAEVPYSPSHGFDASSGAFEW